MEDTLINLLETFGYSVIRQGSLSPSESYPETFITFWNNDEYEATAYDNKTQRVTYDFDVNVYSTDPTTVYNLISNARTLLKQNGFITPSRAHDVGSDEDTHTGRGFNALITVNEN